MNRKILIVDDDPEDILLLQQSLNSRGFSNVETRSSAEKAIEYLESNKSSLPDLILTDLKMPVISGLDFIWEIKARSLFKHIPVIAFSSSPEIPFKECALNAGAINFVSKPSSSAGYKFFVDEVYSTIFS